MQIWILRGRLKVRLVGMILLVALASFAVFPSSATLLSVMGGSRRIPIYRVDVSDRRLALSFDATWGTDLTDDILAILREHGLQTTFFLAGPWIDRYPEYVTRIAAEGHEIGNHSFSHPHMNALSAEAIQRELERNHALIHELSGQEPFLFRPPFGEYNNTVVSTAENLGYYTIQWSLDSLDWKDPSPDSVYTRVTTKVGPGDIILFHNAAPAVPEVLRRLIPWLKEQGYTILPISQLIRREHYFIAHDGTQKARSQP